MLTTDFFTPIVDDPGDSADHGRERMSDVYAMGGRPLFAVNLAAWPGDGLDIALLGQVLRGGAQVAAEAGCFVAAATRSTIRCPSTAWPWSAWPTRTS